VRWLVPRFAVRTEVSIEAESNLQLAVVVEEVETLLQGCPPGVGSLGLAEQDVAV